MQEEKTMYLVEYAEAVRNKDLDYLPEYLIEKQGITLEEAKNLLEAAKDDKTQALKKLAAAFNKKMKAFYSKYSKKHDAIVKKYKKDPKKMKEMIKKLDKQYKETVANWNKSYALSKKNIGSRFGRMKGQIYTAYKMLPKGGKAAVGLGAAGIAAGAGYAGYKAATKKK